MQVDKCRKYRVENSGPGRILCILLIIFTVVFQISLTGSDGRKKGNRNLKTGSPERLRGMLHYTGDSPLLLSAHRGGSMRGYPENSMATFANTLKHTFSIIETDPRYTKDSILVLHHDPVLNRTTNGKGAVSGFTLKELKKLKLKDKEGNLTNYRIPTLKQAIRWARGKTFLILDKKEVSVADRVRLIEQCHAEHYVLVMVYNKEEALECYRLNKNIMMEIFTGSPAKVAEFDKTGIPWSNVIAFVSHQLPDDPSVIPMIHERGAMCILGTSRNVDRELNENIPSDDLKRKYVAIISAGADIIETDLPVPVSKLLSDRILTTLKPGR